ncbi:MAG TPA: hypothetical protein PKO07_11820 [Pseudomonadota bacterium]|nr:hypothetical protein [Pseudomonadota bacterium]
MSTEPSQGKARRINLLFDHNPPTDERLILPLFCNRSIELKRGLEGLSEQDAGGKILAIRGLPRSGKSHFARALLQKAKEEKFPYLFVDVNANTRGTARSVLEELFFKLMKLIRDIHPEDAPEGQSGAYEEQLAELAQYESVVGRQSAQFSLERSSSRRISHEGGIKLERPPFEIHAVTKAESEDAERTGVVQNCLTERELTELLRYAVDFLGWLYPNQRTLVLVDDLDLLDRKGLEQQPESELLIDALATLAEPPSLSGRPPCLIIATIRNTSYSARDKNYRDFVKLRRLEKSHHLDIYRRHIKLFNQDIPVFSEDTIQWLIEKLKDRQIGIFLHHCHEAAEYYYTEMKAGNPISIEQFKAHLEESIRYHLEDPDTSTAISAVIKAAVEDRREIVLDEHPGPLEDKILHLTGSEKRAYRIEAMYFDAVRAMNDRGELR